MWAGKGLLLAALLLTGCSKPPLTAVIPEPVPVAASVGRAWDAVIDHFAQNSVPIRTLERASGLIVTEAMAVAPKDGAAWSDCGGILGTRLGADRAAYNVRVLGDSAASTIRVTILFSASSLACTSKGVYELALMQAIKARAEKRP